MKARSARSAKLGIALAGGGPLGAVYEVGALMALDTALKGFKLTDLDVYVGVSSGAFVAAGLANGVGPREMHALFILEKSHSDPFEPELLLRPAFGEFARRLARLPELALSAARAYLAPASNRGLVESCLPLAQTLPNGLFDNSPIAQYLRRLFSAPGRTDDFRKLSRRLIIVATDLDSGESTPFGAPGLDAVPISEAVKASSALPGLYPPARIGGRDYVDGALKKTLHASVALKEGAKLLICVNPLVPYDAGRAARGGEKSVRLADRGLAAVLSQTFRALIHSRMQVGMERYGREFPDADVVLFEPSEDDSVMFFANIFRYADRRRLAEHAYRRTLADLQRRAGELAPIFQRHGVELDLEALNSPPPLPDGSASRSWPSAEPLAAALTRLERAIEAGAPERGIGHAR